MATQHPDQAPDREAIARGEHTVREHYRAFWRAHGRRADEIRLHPDGRPPIMNIGYWADGARDARQAQLALLRKTTAALPDLAGSRVLDVGCGLAGPATFLHLDHGALVDGITIIDEHVEIARRLVAEAGAAGGVSVRFGSATDMPFDDETFDAVLSLESAHCFPDKPAFVREAFRVLRPGGRLVVVDITATSHLPLVSWQPALRLPLVTPRDWVEILTAGGLQVERVTSIGRGVYPGFLRFLGRTAPERRAQLLKGSRTSGLMRWTVVRRGWVWVKECALDRSVLPIGGSLRLRDYTIASATRPARASGA